MLFAAEEAIASKMPGFWLGFLAGVIAMLSLLIVYGSWAFHAGKDYTNKKEPQRE